jgi:GTP-binding protein EngB required for normal cell division
MEVLDQEIMTPSAAGGEGLSIDEIIDKALELGAQLPATDQIQRYVQNLRDLRERLAAGRLQLAVLGQFNRGKSTFINALIGMPMLPVSVLPSTSIPTVIMHGERTACTVRLRDRQEPLCVRDSVEAIREVLLTYVTEESNPRNQRGVLGVTLECESPVLHHGTVLIDTPGFGSTNVHNTETTRALLSGCDAALFLLSADLPITQVEVDFLREVKRTVPRIFFIFNKIDILEDAELEATREYIQKALAHSTLAAGDVPLIPVSAKKGLAAAHKPQHAVLWRESGMEQVKTDVLDFMLHEKYFALSEALVGKTTDALGGIGSLLESERAALAAPLAELSQQLEAVQARKEDIRRHVEGIAAQLSRDERELREEFGKLVAAKKDQLYDQTAVLLNRLLDAAGPTPRYSQVIRSSLSQMIDEMFGRLFLNIAAAVSRPLRRKAQRYHAAAAALAQRVCAECKLPGEELDPSGIQTIEIDTSAPYKPQVSFEILVEPPRFSLAGVQRRRQLYTKSILPKLNEHIDLCQNDLNRTGKNLVGAAIKKLSEHLLDFCRQILACVERHQGQLQKTLEAKKAETDGHLTLLDGQIKRIREIQAALDPS